MTPMQAAIKRTQPLGEALATYAKDRRERNTARATDALLKGQERKAKEGGAKKTENGDGGGRGGGAEGEAVGTKKAYPHTPKEYEMLETIGEGGSAVVWRARCLPLGDIVAVKILDMEKCSNSLDNIHKEVQMMTMTCHPNLVHAYAFFSVGHFLWVVMPYCDAGSCLHVMKSKYPSGLDQPTVATILRDTLQALAYLHYHGHIHRDVKASNILLDKHGVVRLADFGVSAGMFETADRLQEKESFVGTPLWMAPELLRRGQYNQKADIWSFGITALELAHGHAPFSGASPMEVLTNTIRGPAPGLDKEHARKFSKSFKDMVARCLVKDPHNRPRAAALLKHSFFNHAKNSEYLVSHVIQTLPLSLPEREKSLQEKEAEVGAQHPADSMLSREMESLRRYKLEISSWDFDMDMTRERNTSPSSSEDEGSVQRRNDQSADCAAAKH